MKNSIRQSNIELLRILCMVMIIVHHLLLRFYPVPVLLGTEGETTPTMMTATTLNSFCYVGVNVFILISGYFGIRFKWKGLFSLYFAMVFYALLQTVTDVWIENKPITFIEIKEAILVVSHFSEKHWWFMICYLMLYTVSPLIRLDLLTKKQYNALMILLLYFNFYYGYWMRGQFVGNGYAISQFLFLYVVGDYLRRYVQVKTNHRYIYLLIYLLGCSCFAILSIQSHNMYLSHWVALGYNNPILVLASIGLMYFFLTLKIQSRIINFCAASALAMYLFQNNNLTVISNWLKNILDMNNPVILSVSLIIVAILFAVITVGVDQIRLLFYKLIVSKVPKFNDKKDFT